MGRRWYGLKVFTCGMTSLSSSHSSAPTLQKEFHLYFNPSLFILCKTILFIIYYLSFTIYFINLNAIQLEGIRNLSSCPHTAAQRSLGLKWECHCWLCAFPGAKARAVSWVCLGLVSSYREGPEDTILNPRCRFWNCLLPSPNVLQRQPLYLLTE